MESVKNGQLFNTELLSEIRNKFYHIDFDPVTNKKRIYFDNAGGSFRLKQAVKVFAEFDAIPDNQERKHETAAYLNSIKKQAEADIRTMLNATDGSIATYLTASQGMFELTRIITENARGSNVVTTALEHPSAYDSAKLYSDKLGLELRVAKTNPVTGGVDTEEILKLIDENTSLLSVIYASNISGAIQDIEDIVRKAKAINPSLYIIVDAVQHAPHGVIDLEKTPIDVINFAPYKMFGVRGIGFVYLSDRVARMPHHKLFGKMESDWDLGSPAIAHYASVTEIVNYVCFIGEGFTNSKDRRELFVQGMNHLLFHERALLDQLLNGTDTVPGLRNMEGITVHFDTDDFEKRDFIVAFSINGLDYDEAVRLYERQGIIIYERVSSSVYSKRMLESFGLEGCLRVSPLHCNSSEEIVEFLQITNEIILNETK